jgi:hypothetical protein
MKLFTSEMSHTDATCPTATFQCIPKDCNAVITLAFCCISSHLWNPPSSSSKMFVSCLLRCSSHPVRAKCSGMPDPESANSYVWACRKVIDRWWYNAWRSTYYSFWFAGSQLTLLNIMLLSHYIVSHIPARTIRLELTADHHTVTIEGL